MNDYYFARLFREHKLAFVIVTGFTICTLVTTLLGDEITPFFVWGMFSQKETPRYEQEIVEIRVNDEVFNYYTELTNFNRHMLIGPISFYTNMEANGGVHPTRKFFKDRLTEAQYKSWAPTIFSITNDPSIKREFEDWVFRYLDHSADEPIERLEVFLNTYRYESPRRLILMQQDTVLHL
ncbi:MAG: hypothetical protein AAF598_00345 [Bacteroidota bacterium]